MWPNPWRMRVGTVRGPECKRRLSGREGKTARGRSSDSGGSPGGRKFWADWGKNSPSWAGFLPCGSDCEADAGRTVAGSGRMIGCWSTWKSTTMRWLRLRFRSPEGNRNSASSTWYHPASSSPVVGGKRKKNASTRHRPAANRWQPPSPRWPDRPCNPRPYRSAPTGSGTAIDNFFKNKIWLKPERLGVKSWTRATHLTVVSPIKRKWHLMEAEYELLAVNETDYFGINLKLKWNKVKRGHFRLHLSRGLGNSNQIKIPWFGYYLLSRSIPFD